MSILGQPFNPTKRAAAVMERIRRDTHELAATEEELYAFE